MPALLVVGCQLKCAYRSDGGRFVTFTYHPVVTNPASRDCKFGSWQEDTSALRPIDNSKYLALGELKTAKGAQLIAVRTRTLESDSDGNLFYSWLADTTWTEDVRLPALTSKLGAALASCGSNLYMFFASANGSLHARK